MQWEKMWKHMKRSSTSSAIREMKMKTRVRYHYTTEFASVKQMENTKCWFLYRAPGILLYCWWEHNSVQSLRKTDSVCYNWYTHSYDAEITLLGLYPTEKKCMFQCTYFMYLLTYMNFLSSTFCKSQKMGTTQMSVNYRMDN